MPFKVYVLTAWLAARCYVHAAGWHYDTEVVLVVALGYMLCLVVLVAGGIVQRVCGRREDSTGTFLAAALAGLFCWLLLPGLARA